MYIDLIVMRHVIGNKQLIYVAKIKGRKQKAFQTDDMKIRYDCAKHYQILCMNCANGIVFRLRSVISVIIFFLMCHLLSSITR